MDNEELLSFSYKSASKNHQWRSQRFIEFMVRSATRRFCLSVDRHSGTAPEVALFGQARKEQAKTLIEKIKLNLSN